MNRRALLTAIPGLMVAPRLLTALPVTATAAPLQGIYYIDTDMAGRRFGTDRPVSRADMVHEYGPGELERQEKLALLFATNRIYGKRPGR